MSPVSAPSANTAVQRSPGRWQTRPNATTVALRRVARGSSLLALGIASGVLILWVLVPEFSWSGMQRHWVLMSPQAAVGFGLLAASFYFKNQTTGATPTGPPFFLGCLVALFVAADALFSPAPLTESTFTSAAQIGLCLLLLGAPHAHRWRNKFGDVAGGGNLVLIVGYAYFLIAYCHGAYVLPGNHIPCPRLLSVFCTVLLSIAHLATLGPVYFPARLFYGRSVRAVLLRKSLPVTLVILLTYTCVKGSMPAFLDPPLSMFLTLVTSTAIVLYLILRSSVVVSGHLESALQESEQNYTHLVRGLKDFAIFLLNARGDVLVWNAGAEGIIGYKASEVLGEPISRVFSGREPRLDLDAALEQVERTGHFQTEGWVGRKNAPPFWAETSLSKLTGPQGAMMGISVIIRDATERRKAEESIRSSLHEKEVLLKEVHHRVKNNLQVISSLLRLQAEAVPDKNVASLFSDSQERVQAMAMVHEHLYTSEDLSRINFRSYVASLVRNLHRTFGPPSLQHPPTVLVEDVLLSLDRAVPCGLILTELISNALKYAYPGTTGGPIVVQFATRPGGNFELSVADRGVGFPRGYNWALTDSLGLRLLRLLTEQINGTLRMENHDGVKFLVTFRNESVS